MTPVMLHLKCKLRYHFSIGAAEDLDKILRQVHKAFFNIHIILGTDLVKIGLWYFIQVQEGFDILLGHLNLLFTVDFVAYNPYLCCLRDVPLIELRHPAFKMLEGLLIQHVENQHDPVGSSIIMSNNGFEPFLPGSVPDLKLDMLAVNNNRFYLKINPYRGRTVLAVGVVCVPLHQAGLSDAGVAYQNNLEKIIMRIFHGLKFALAKN